MYSALLRSRFVQSLHSCKRSHFFPPPPLRPFFPTTGVFCLMHHKTQMEVYMEKWQTSTMKKPKNLPLKMSDHRQIQIRPTRNPHKKNLTLLQPPDTTPQRRKMNFFRLNMWTSWWPRFGPKWIRRSRRQFHITSRARKPISRLMWTTMRKPRRLRKSTLKRVSQTRIQERQ